ncbi:MFS general substrate transporter [Trichocladium antarcticum]|uniref:MFS general substrate transporter n=1 Tax=Trichocladium antarcticum TaxID=1450529 RepID=A0AAN6ZAY8_9PEZI|nr:MFS general substrate transporter [Trichocladium antarcticum]
MTIALAAGDETQPLLRTDRNKGPPHDVADPADPADTIIVDFDPRGDAENPLEWPTPFKWTIVSMLAFMAFTVTFTCISPVPLASDIVRDLSGSSTPSKSSSVLLVTIWELGEAAGPLLIAPLSELHGRYRVMNAANVLFVGATVLAATSASVAQLVAARMLTGLAVAGNVLNPAIVGDVFAREERGSALSLIYLAPLVGGAAGPLVASAVAQAYGWRAVVWMAAALSAACEVLFLTCFRETYKVAILRRRAAAMAAHAAGSGKTFRTAFDDDAEAVGRGERAAGWRALRDAVLRPAVVLFGSGVLLVMSLFAAVVFTFFYVMSTTLGDILADRYHLSPIAVGSCYAVFSLGSTLSVFFCNHWLDRIYIRMRDAHKGVGQPEFRLPVAIVGGFLLPVAVLSYGWATELRLPLVLLLSSTCLIGVALMLGIIPVMAYVVDAFGVYSASAMTGVIVMRCLMGTFLPLTTAPLVDRFGWGWGFTVFAGAILLTAPVPVLMLRYGAYWRRFSKYSRDA